jgi:multisubunit Na+/H+ antiporter MnhB subunit
VLGIFLLLAVRNPAANRSLIAFTAWSSFAYAVVMSALALQPKQAAERTGFLAGSAVLVIIGVVLLILSPPKQSRELTSTASA